MLPLNVNGYQQKAMYAILRNPTESMASFAGIAQAANAEPGTHAALMDFEKEMAARRHEPPTWDTEAAISRETPGASWKHLREMLNTQGAMSTHRGDIDKFHQWAEANLPRRFDANKEQIQAADAHQQQLRKELQAEHSRARAASGKSQILQQVRNAYTALTGANITAVRMAFDKLVG